MASTITKAQTAALPTERLLDLSVNTNGFVFDPRTGQSFSANHSALTVLSLLQTGKEPRSCAGVLSEIYDVSVEIAAASIDSFLAQLRRYL